MKIDTDAAAAGAATSAAASRETSLKTVKPEGTAKAATPAAESVSIHLHSLFSFLIFIFISILIFSFICAIDGTGFVLINAGGGLNSFVSAFIIFGAGNSTAEKFVKS